MLAFKEEFERLSSELVMQGSTVDLPPGYLPVKNIISVLELAPRLRVPRTQVSDGETLPGHINTHYPHRLIAYHRTTYQDMLKYTYILSIHTHPINSHTRQLT